MTLIMPGATPEAAANVIALVDKNLPMGWEKRPVESPWRGVPLACRGCGKDPGRAYIAQPDLRWSPHAFLRKDRRNKILWYSCALVCENCAGHQPTMDKIAIQIFAPHTPEAGLPPVTVETIIKPS